MAADLEIRIAAEFTEVKAALAALKRDLGGVGQAAQRAGDGSRSLNRIEQSLQGALGAVRNLVGGFAAFATIRSILRLADEVETLNARLRIASRNTDEFVRAQADLFGIAQRTRSSLNDTVDLYTRLAQATRESGVSQEQLLQITETVNQAIQLSGVSAQAAQAALVQFGQGLSAGALRGEELNSILEQTPGLADAIAKGLGVSRGELRRLGEQGQLTADALIGALSNVAPQVQRDFEQLPLTIGQAFTRLTNSFTRLVGQVNSATGATRGFASVINDIASALSSDEFLAGAETFARTWGAAFADFAEDARRAFSIVNDVGRSLLGQGLFDFLFTAIRDFPINVRASVRIAVVSFAAMIDSFVAQVRFLRDAIVAVFSDDTIAAALERRNRAISVAVTTAREQIADIVEEAENAKRQAAQATADRRRAEEEARRRAQGAGAPQRQTRELVGVANAFELERDAAARSVRALEELYRQARISLDEYLNARVEAQLRAVDAEIAAEQRRLAEAVKARKQDDANKAATRLAILQRERSDVVTQAEGTRAEETRRFAETRTDIEARELERRGQLEQAALLRLQSQYSETLRRLRAEGDEQGVRIVEGIINTEAARARFQELQRQAQDIQSRLDSRLQSLADQRSAGAISSDAAISGGREARQQATLELEALNAQLAELATRTNDPEIARGAQQTADALAKIRRDGLEGTDLAISNLIASLDNMKKGLAATVADAGVSALENFFVSLGDSSTSAGDKIRDFGRSFAASMAQIAARALATYAVLQLLEAIFPGAGRLAASTGSATAGVFHSGGRVGSGGGRRRVSPLLFAGAPRFHSGSGGALGLKSDEVPAILQTGEEVLSRTDPRNSANGGQQGVRIVNAVDPNLVGDYMSSPGGERTIVNMIARNRGQIKQIIG